MQNLITKSSSSRATLAALVLLLGFAVAAVAQPQKNSMQPGADSTSAHKAQAAGQDTKQDVSTSGAAAQTNEQSETKKVPLTPEEARRAQLVADTNKLYQLAQELQAEVAKTNKDTLSLAVIKKAAEVEKLAKSLKERMKEQ